MDDMRPDFRSELLGKRVTTVSFIWDYMELTLADYERLQIYYRPIILLQD